MPSLTVLPINVDEELLEEVKSVLDKTLQLDGRGTELEVDSKLLGSLPELDSMAVVTLVSGLENHFGFTVDDDELVSDIFASLGSLTRFVSEKIER